jgi:hypothetical protein
MGKDSQNFVERPRQFRQSDQLSVAPRPLDYRDCTRAVHPQSGRCRRAFHLARLVLLKRQTNRRRLHRSDRLLQVALRRVRPKGRIRF